MELALYGSFLPIPSHSMFPIIAATERETHPGQIIHAEDPITLCPNRKRVTIKVTNNGDRSVQVASHYHFIEANPYILFDRALSYGMRLDIPAGTHS